MHHHYSASPPASTSWPQAFGSRHGPPPTGVPAPAPTHYPTAYPNPATYTNNPWSHHTAQTTSHGYQHPPNPSTVYPGFDMMSHQYPPPVETAPETFQPAYSSDLASGVHGFGAAIPPPNRTPRYPTHRVKPPSIRPLGTSGPRSHEPSSWRGATRLPPAPPPPRFPVKAFVPAGTQESLTNATPVDAKDPHGALKRLQMLAQQNCVEAKFNETAYEGRVKVTLLLGSETYEGTGTNAQDAKHNAALQAVTNTHYRPKSTMKIRPENATPTSDLNVMASRKGLKMEFVFLEPANFVYNSAMKMWSKDDMRGNYRVKLEIAGMDFYGQADMPQLAKHNASRQALPVIQALPDMKDVLQQQAMSSSAISESDQINSSPIEPVAPTDAAIELNRISMCRDVAPEWEVLSESGPPHQKLFTLKCTFGEYSATGTARAKKMAKSLAAADILKILPPEWKAPHQKTKKKQKKRKATSSSENDGASKKACTDPSGPVSTPMIGPVIPTSPSKSKKEDTSSGKRVYEVVQVANPICALYEYANRAKLPDPVFECVSENLIKTWEKNGKLFRKLEFTFRLGFKDKEYFATAPLKKTAKTQVATEAWNLIRGELF